MKTLTTKDTLRVVAQNMSERDLMDTVMEFCRAHGFLVYHPYDSRYSEPGFPDIVAAGHGRCIFIEFKRHGQGLRQGRMGRRRWQPGQDEWRDAIESCKGVSYYLLRPMSWLDGSFQLFIEGEGINGHKG
jgi:hypothetical protein